jgi:predicted ATPase with chaperone activity
VNEASGKVYESTIAVANPPAQGEPSAAIRERIAAARNVQTKRFKGTRLLTNADMGLAEAAS